MANQLFETELCVHLQVVHVPGLVMIQQGSDALSWWPGLPPLQISMNQQALTTTVFAPLTPDRILIQAYVNKYQLQISYQGQPWYVECCTSNLTNRFT